MLLCRRPGCWCPVLEYLNAGGALWRNTWMNAGDTPLWNTWMQAVFCCEIHECRWHFAVKCMKAGHALLWPSYGKVASGCEILLWDTLMRVGLAVGYLDTGDVSHLGALMQVVSRCGKHACRCCPAVGSMHVGAVLLWNICTWVELGCGKGLQTLGGIHAHQTMVMPEH